MISEAFGKRIFGSAVVLCLLAGTVSFSMAPVTTVNAAVTAESIKEKEGQIKDAKKERDSMKNSLTDLQSVKKSLEKEKSDLNTYITQLDANLDDIQKKIEDLIGRIEQKEQDIEITSAELEEDIRIQNEQYEAMKKRMDRLRESIREEIIDCLEMNCRGGEEDA